MPAISRKVWGNHDEAVAILKDPARLNCEGARDFVLNNWNPQVGHNVGKEGAFFTPEYVAQELMAVTLPRRRVIDMFAGIGRLAYTAYQYAHWEEIQLTCVEINPDYAEVGRKILPQAEWIVGNLFDEQFVKSLGEFDYALLNPPFGRPASLKGVDTRWLMTHGQTAEIMALEIACRLTDSGAIIMPSPLRGRPDTRPLAEGGALNTHTDYDVWRREYQKDKSHSRLFRDTYPLFSLHPVDIDWAEARWNGTMISTEVAHFKTCP